MMKKIFIIDGGPRKNMNTAQMVESFTKGVQDTSSEIEVKHIRLYDYDFHGCYACMACKVKGTKFHDYCGRKDGITDILQEAAYADGMVFASPVYYGDVTAQTKCFIERITFPWLSYENFSTNPPKKNIPSAIIYTMNAGEENQDIIENMCQHNEWLLGMFYEKPDRILAKSTKQVKDYSRFEFSEAMAQSHDQWHEEHFAEELQSAYDAGKRMAEKVMD
ncbi:MAG: flavodoxin family protein [Bacteroidales bacterium]|nr:flavodoxin family protein [Bacteroidales bacterium]